jgi:hypothetical protein
MNASGCAARCLLAVLLLTGTGGRVEAFPLRGVAMWELVEGSKRIVVARVVNVSAELDGRVPVELAVEESWKGDHEERLTVYTSHATSWLCPGIYQAGRRVLAFLRLDDDGYWVTTAGGFGSLHPQAGDFDVYRDRVEEAIALQARGNVSPDELDAWRLRTAERRATRWHGLYPLWRGSWNHSKSERRAELGRRVAMAHAFVAEPAADITLQMTLAYVDDLRIPSFDAAVVAEIVPLLEAQPPPPWLKEALRLARPRCPDRRLRDRIKTRFRELPKDWSVPGGVNGRRDQGPGPWTCTITLDPNWKRSK